MNSNDYNTEAKQAGVIKPMKFLQIEENQEANFKETHNQTIAERFPDFPSNDLDTPVGGESDSDITPIFDKAADVQAAANQTKNINSTQIIISASNNTNNENNVTGTSVSSNNKTDSVDVLQEKKNSTSIRIAENRTIVIDLPLKEEPNININTTSAQEDKKAANATIPDVISVVNKNQTGKAAGLNASASASEQQQEEDNKNIIIVNETLTSNVTVIDESCDLEGEEQEELNDEVKHQNKHKKNHKSHESKHKKASKHHHGKRCRNKKHAHFIELAEAESTNLIQESKIYYFYS